jgi:hypothetical protein
MLNNARYRAKQLGVPFSIELSDILIPEQCPIPTCAAVLSPSSRNTTPSLDKIVPRLGYTPENIVVICNRCNRKKNDMSPEEMYAIADYVYRLRKVRGLC